MKRQLEDPEEKTEIATFSRIPEGFKNPERLRHVVEAFEKEIKGVLEERYVCRSILIYERHLYSHLGRPAADFIVGRS